MLCGQSLRLLGRAVVAALLLPWAPPVNGAPVADLYVARVAAGATSGPALDAAFGQALDDVVVKLTGQRRSAGLGSGGALGDPAALLRQYQLLPDGTVRVEFEPGALRRRLDQANLPVWSDDRPLTLVRVELPAGPAGTPDNVEEVLTATAARRGVPIVLASAVPDVVERIEDLAAAPLARPDAVLLGRPVPSAGTQSYRWTLELGELRYEWQGDAGEGIHGLANRLAERHATTAAGVRELRLLVRSVGDFAAFGRLQSELRALDVVERVDIEKMAGDGILFVVRARGDRERLREALASKPQLREVDPLTAVLEVPSADLVYQLAGGR